MKLSVGTLSLEKQQTIFAANRDISAGH